MFNVSVRKIVVSAVAIAAPIALLSRRFDRGLGWQDQLLGQERRHTANTTGKDLHLAGKTTWDKTSRWLARPALGQEDQLLGLNQTSTLFPSVLAQAGW